MFDASEQMQGIMHCWLSSSGSSDKAMHVLKMGVQDREDARMTFEGTMRCFHHFRADRTEMDARFSRQQKTEEDFIAVARIVSNEGDYAVLWTRLLYSRCTSEASMLLVRDCGDDCD